MTRIALVGLMGSGKSTVGRAMAMLRKTNFCDLDTYIEQWMQMPIPELFETVGERGFRELEQLALTELRAAGYDGICATGGGIIVTPACREQLMQDWYVVWLDSRIDTIVARLSGETHHRPMLATSLSLKDRLIQLYDARSRYYGQVADLRVDVDDISPRELANEIWVHYDARRDA